MPVSFPLSVEDGFYALNVAATKIDLTEALARSTSEGGETWAGDWGDPFWTADLRLATQGPQGSAARAAVLNILRRAGASMLIYDTRMEYPAADPDGSILGASAVTIASLPTVRSMTLTGLPAGYVLSRGDRIGFTYDGGKRAYHQLAETVTADGAGTTPEFEVDPFIRPGATVATAVELIRPMMRVAYAPGSLSASPSDVASGGPASLSVYQVF